MLTNPDPEVTPHDITVIVYVRFAMPFSLRLTSRIYGYTTLS